MKRILCALIALAMLLCLLGTAFADDLKGDAFAGYPIQTGGSLRLWTSGLAYHSDYASEEESPYHQWLEEFTGVDIVWERPAAGADSTQAYNLMIATGDLPDIIYKGGLPAEVETMLDDGVFIALDDYMADYAPALYNFLEENPDYKKPVLSDSGHYYVFPFFREDVAWLGTWLGASVNSTMLGELGLERPETIAELDSLVYALKDLEDCDYPMCFYNTSHIRTLLGPAFGFNGNDRYYIDENGKAATWMNAPGLKDALTLANKWYTDGIIDPDFTSLDLIGFVSKFVSSRIGITVYGSATPARFYQQIVDRDGDYDYIGITYPVQNKGDEVLFSQAEAMWTGTGAVITTACENVPLAMRFLDYGYTEEGILHWNYGKEGESFYYDDAGVPHMMDSILNAEEGATLALSRYTSMTANGISIMSLAWNRGKQLPLAVKLVDEWTSSAPNAPLHQWPSVCATIEETNELANIQSTLTTYADEMYLKFVLGTESLDNFDAYLNTLKDMGIDRVLEIKQNQLDRYNAR